MTLYKVACTAITALAVLGACRREDTTAVAPATPPTAQQPADAAPASTGTTAGVAQAVDDATITARVKTALLAADEVKGLAIDVDTSQGAVQLKGEVRTQEQAQRAEQIAREADGVQRVENQLTVRPAS